eukprot:scaffold1253_cov245-Pinguiococcus_pyrenoidosus.AAC.2
MQRVRSKSKKDGKQIVSLCHGQIDPSTAPDVISSTLRGRRKCAANRWRVDMSTGPPGRGIGAVAIWSAAGCWSSDASEAVRPVERTMNIGPKRHPTPSSSSSCCRSSAPSACSAQRVAHARGMDGRIIFPAACPAGPCFLPSIPLVAGKSRAASKQVLAPFGPSAL